METYNKIPAIFKRDSENPKQVLDGVYKDKYVEALADSPIWTATEKIDGTNVRIHWDGYRVSIAGRRAPQVQGNVNDAIVKEYPYLEEMFEQEFPNIEPMSGGTQVTVYGEGFGPGVNKGGNYGDRIRFAAFDVMIDNTYLDDENARDVVAKLGLKFVPSLPELVMPWVLLEDMRDILDGNGAIASIEYSHYGNFRPEGFVLKPDVPLYKSNGDRVLVKLTYRDIKDML